MSKSLIPLVLSNTFGVLMNRINDLVSALNTITVTTDADGSGGVTSGNGHINGVFSSNIFRANTIGGGNTSNVGLLTIDTAVQLASNTIINGETNIAGNINLTGNIVANNTNSEFNSSTFKVSSPQININSSNTNIASIRMHTLANNVFIVANNQLSVTSLHSIFTANTANVSVNNMVINGNTTFSNILNANVSGSSTKLATPMRLTLSGGLSGNVSFDGSSNVILSAAIIPDSHTHTISNITNLTATLDGKLSTTGTATNSSRLNGFLGTEYVRSNANTNISGSMIFNSNTKITMGANNAFDMFMESNTNTMVMDFEYSNFYLRRKVDANQRFAFNLGNGNFIADGNVTSYSDKRLKSDIKPLENALDKIKKLLGCSFIKDGNNGIGLIAQDVENVIPEVVFDDETENHYKTVAYANLVAYLIEAIKELDQKIEDLKK